MDVIVNGRTYGLALAAGALHKLEKAVGSSLAGSVSLMAANPAVGADLLNRFYSLEGQCQAVWACLESDLRADGITSPNMILDKGDFSTITPAVAAELNDWYSIIAGLKKELKASNPTTPPENSGG